MLAVIFFTFILSHRLLLLFKTDIPLPSFKTFEEMSARTETNSSSGFFVCLYSLQNGTGQFFDEF